MFTPRVNTMCIVLLQLLHIWELFTFWFWHFLPLFNANFLQLCQIRQRMLVDSNFHIMPQIFNWFYVWALTQPSENTNLLFFKPLLCSFCPVLWLSGSLLVTKYPNLICNLYKIWYCNTAKSEINHLAGGCEYFLDSLFVWKTLERFITNKTTAAKVK